MSLYRASPYPDDYPKTQIAFNGINIYDGRMPNRYRFMYESRPYQTFYNRDAGVIVGQCPNNRVGTEITPKAFPYTDRPTKDYMVYGAPIVYKSLLDDMGLRTAHTFYLNDRFTH